MNDLINTMLRNGVALNPWFFEDKKTINSKYPPHNTVQISEDCYRLTLAVAGFTEDELEITLQNEYLTVYGKKEANKYIDPDTYYSLPQTSTDPKVVQKEQTEFRPKVLYRGIGFRDFTSQFMIGDVEVKSATLKNGLLEIDLIRHIPETKKLKKITIGS